MKRLLRSLPLLALLTTACQHAAPNLKPNYEGQYRIEFSTQTNFDNTPVSTTTTITGRLTVVRNGDGTYQLTEKRPNNTERSYLIKLVGTTFDVPTETESFPVNGVNYDVPFTGTGEFKTNSVIITRKAAFTAGTVRVNSQWTSYAYR